MKANKRFVLDTNTLVSAAIFRNSVPAQALRFAILNGVLVFSPETEHEFVQVLSRAKFDKYLARSERIAFVTATMQYAVMLEGIPPLLACRDPKDDKFLSLAVYAQSAALVTGDDDLLVLHPFQGIAIVRPAEFVLQEGATCDGD